jgi:hypothetical protein
MWLIEPTVEDSSWGIRGEQPMKWLERSTLPEAKNYRDFLNYNLLKLPEENQKDFYNALHQRFKSAFFELVVARTLQILGAEIKIEIPQENGKQPDFVANFAKQTIVVEAVSPNFNTEIGNELKKRNPLYELIERAAPDGWIVNVLELPEIGLADSKKEFRRVISKMLNILPPSNDTKELELVRTISTGTINLHLIAKGPNHRSIGWEAPMAVFSDTKERIQRVVERKKRQVRAVNVPAFVAIEGSWFSGSYEDYDMALFGHTCAVLNEKREFQEPIFVPDGVFAEIRPEPPTYAGAFIFPEVGMNSVENPILYKHPRFEEALPSELSVLEQRIFEHGKGLSSIQTLPTNKPDLLKAMQLFK